MPSKMFRRAILIYLIRNDKKQRFNEKFHKMTGLNLMNYVQD